MAVCDLAKYTIRDLDNYTTIKWNWLNLEMRKSFEIDSEKGNFLVHFATIINNHSEILNFRYYVKFGAMHKITHYFYQYYFGNYVVELWFFCPIFSFNLLNFFVYLFV